mgnify:CR=1 FL=1
MQIRYEKQEKTFGFYREYAQMKDLGKVLKNFSAFKRRISNEQENV